MKRLQFSRIGPIAIVTGLLASLALATPSYNANNVTPRSVFLQLPQTLPEPTVALQAEQRGDGHWILMIHAMAFQFTDLCVADAKAVPVGHAHVIRDGVKIASAYEPVLDLGPLPPGRHRLSAVLRGQDHRALLGADGLIYAELVIEVTAAQFRL